MGKIFRVIAVLKNVDFGGEIDTTLKRHEKLNYEKIFFPSLSPSKIMIYIGVLGEVMGKIFWEIAVLKNVVSLMLKILQTENSAKTKITQKIFPISPPKTPM